MPVWRLVAPGSEILSNISSRTQDVSDFVKLFQLKYTEKPVRARTISDEDSACQHFAQHELDDGQDDADQTADNGHAEQEAILRSRHREHSSNMSAGMDNASIPSSSSLKNSFLCVTWINLSWSSGW